MTHAVRFWFRAPHLSAATVACAIVAVATWLLLGVFHLEKRLAHLTAPEMLDVKDQGVTLQDEAFRDRDLLPAYGSSEFRNDTPFSGRGFFSTYPTGFRLFIVGKAGSKSLITAERIGSLGAAVRGRKVVIILSPTWFLSNEEPTASYGGNFSALQADELIFKSPLSAGLKADLAREMLNYPATLAGHPLLRFELKRLASAHSNLEDRLAMDIGRSEDALLGIVDRLETTFALSGQIVENARFLSSVSRHPKAHPDWTDLTRQAASHSSPESWEEASDAAAPKLAKKLRSHGDISFEARLNQSDEWRHLELLMRTLRELGAKPLFISIPFNARAFEMAGVKPAEIQSYYDRLRREIAPFGFPAATFQSEQDDPYFFADSLGHPSSMGWMIFNHTINQFYHGKFPPSVD